MVVGGLGSRRRRTNDRLQKAVSLGVGQYSKASSSSSATALIHSKAAAMIHAKVLCPPAPPPPPLQAKSVAISPPVAKTWATTSPPPPAKVWAAWPPPDRLGAEAPSTTESYNSPEYDPFEELADMEVRAPSKVESVELHQSRPMIMVTFSSQMHAQEFLSLGLKHVAQFEIDRCELDSRNHCVLYIQLKTDRNQLALSTFDEFFFTLIDSDK